MTTTFAPTRSWPSRNTVADTGISSSITALAGHCPADTTGETSEMTMRPITSGTLPSLRKALAVNRGRSANSPVSTCRHLAVSANRQARTVPFVADPHYASAEQGGPDELREVRVGIRQ